MTFMQLIEKTRELGKALEVAREAHRVAFREVAGAIEHAAHRINEAGLDGGFSALGKVEEYSVIGEYICGTCEIEFRNELEYYEFEIPLRACESEEELEKYIAEEKDRLARERLERDTQRRRDSEKAELKHLRKLAKRHKYKLVKEDAP